MITIESKLESIKRLSRTANNVLPQYGTCDITLRFETKSEIEQIAKRLKLSLHNSSPDLPYTWCAYKNGPVTITCQTHECENSNETNPINFN